MVKLELFAATERYRSLHGMRFNDENLGENPKTSEESSCSLCFCSYNWGIYPIFKHSYSLKRPHIKPGWSSRKRTKPCTDVRERLLHHCVFLRWLVEIRFWLKKTCLECRKTNIERSPIHLHWVYSLR